ncbi:MAG: acetate kinase [Gaiellaceae bacterium]|jgi:acetate kinase|nr:acetate kinase [Gaiellaceae bacterium]
MGPILVVNAGSTSLKLHVVTADGESGAVESFAAAAGKICAVAHRVVHGGAHFRDPVLIDAAVRAKIRELIVLAPLHNAPALEAIDAAQRELPNVPHVAVFDTSFHRTIPAEAYEYAVPRSWREDWGIRRYGFQGLSVEWCAERVPELLGHPVERLVVCHLGGGSSVTAVVSERSVDTTMGFTPLEGVPMNTRSGSVDPGALLYVLREGLLDADALDHALNVDSGVRGLAGGGDMIEIEHRATAGDQAPELALAVMLHRLAAAVAAMAASTGGLDALAFTGGIGEGSALVRERLCSRLGFLGVELDAEKNEKRELDCDIAAEASAVRILVVQAREELVAARAASALLGSA